MNGIAEIRSGLEAGIAAAVSLRTWVKTPAGHDLVDWREQQLRDGLKALAEVERHLKPCPLPHLDITYDKPSACYCNAVNNPPCNWCTDGGGDDVHPDQWTGEGIAAMIAANPEPDAWYEQPDTTSVSKESN